MGIDTAEPGFVSPADEHRAGGQGALRVAVLTVSDTRTVATDTGGALVKALLEQSGHLVVAARIVPDDDDAIRAGAQDWVEDPEIDAVIVTGGTGIAPRDRTAEALLPILDRTIDGFGELFRMLSFEEIGSAAMLSRAFGGIAGHTPIFALPGSRNAIALAMDRLIVPELGHVVFESRKGLERNGSSV